MIVRKNRFRPVRISLIVLSCFLVIACGGGGGSSSPAEQSPSAETDPEDTSDSSESALRLISRISMGDLNDPHALAFSPDGTEIALASTTGELRLRTVNIYSVATGEFTRSMDNSSLETEFMNSAFIADLFWAEDGILTADVAVGTRLYWQSGTGEEINFVELGFSEACVAPVGFLHVFDPSTNQVFDNEGLASDTETVCIFHQSDQSISQAVINSPPGRVDSGLLSVDKETLWVNYGDPEIPVNNSSVATVEYDKNTLEATGRTVTEGIVVAITESHRLIKQGLEYFLYPGGQQLDLPGTAVLADPTGEVIASSAPSVSDSKLRFVSLPDGLLIGELPKDFGSRRRFSQDGRMVAVPYDTYIEIYDVTGRTEISVLN